MLIDCLMGFIDNFFLCLGIGGNMVRNIFALFVGFVAIFGAVFCPSNAMANKYPDVKVGGLIAGQYVYDQTEDKLPSNELKFNYARIQVGGKLNDNLGGLVQFKAKSGSPAISVAYINLDYFPNTNVRIGRIKSPFGLEILEHPFKNPIISFSDVSKDIWPGCDMGVKVTYKHKYATGIIAYQNGNKVALVDDNDAKDICGRLVVAPVKGFDVGGSYYMGKSGTYHLATNRYGVEANYKAGPLWLRGEFLNAKSAKNEPIIDTVRSVGYYALATYKLLSQVEAIARYSVYDLNTDTDDNEKTNITIGLNYYLISDTWNRISLNYEIRNDKADEKIGNLLTLQVQILL